MISRHVLGFMMIAIAGTTAWLIPALGATISQPTDAKPVRSNRIVLRFIASPTLPGLEKDFTRVCDLFKKGVDAVNEGVAEGDDRHVTYQPPLAPILIGAQSDREWFGQEITRPLEIDERTTYVVYYRGHGFSHPRKPAHYLYLDRYNPMDPTFAVSREDVRKLLKAKGSRLNILVTECCAHPIAASLAFLRHLAPVPGFKELFSDLFLKPRGMVDITSSRYTFDIEKRKAHGEQSWFTSEGGIFNIALHEALLAQNAHMTLDTNKNRTVEWGEALASIQERANRRYVSMREEYLQPEKAVFLSGEDEKSLKEQRSQIPLGVFDIE